MNEDVESVIMDMDTRLESLQKDNRSMLYYIAWYALGVIVTIAMHAFMPPYGVLIGIVWVVNAVAMMVRLQKFVV